LAAADLRTLSILFFVSTDYSSSSEKGGSSGRRTSEDDSFS